MHRSAKRWVRACSYCGCRKPSRPIHAGITEPVMVTYRNMVWSIDIVGPFLVTKRGNKYLITMCDCFTRWGEATAIVSFKEKEVIDFIYHLICRRGRPERIVTDQGKSLVSKSVKTMCRRWSIRDIMISADNQQANGTGERGKQFLVRH
jgi:transposase InsO family protein